MTSLAWTFNSKWLIHHRYCLHWGIFLIRVSDLQNFLLSVRFKVIIQFLNSLIGWRIYTVICRLEVHCTFVSIKKNRNFLRKREAFILRYLQIVVHLHSLLRLTFLKCYFDIAPAHIKALFFLTLYFLLSIGCTFLFLKTECGTIFQLNRTTYILACFQRLWVSFFHIDLILKFFVVCRRTRFRTARALRWWICFVFCSHGLSLENGRSFSKW